MYLILIALILVLAGGYSAYYNNYGTVLKKAKKRLAQGQPQIALKLFKSGNKQYPIIAEKFLQQDGQALLQSENKQAAIDFLLPLAEDYPFIANWLAEHAAQLLAQKEFIPFRHLVLSAPKADWAKKLLFKYIELPEAQSKLKISDKKQLLQPLLDQKETNAIRLWVLLLAPFFEQDKKAEQYLPEIRTYKAQSAKAQQLFYLFLSNRQKKRELAPYLSELQQLAKESTSAQEIILAEAKTLFERKNEATALALIQPFLEKNADAQRLYNRIYLKKMSAEKKPKALAQVLQALERFPSQLTSQEKIELQTALANLQLQQLEYSFKPLRKKANLNDWASFVQQLLAAAKLSYKTTALEAFLQEKVNYLLRFSLEEGQSAEKAKQYKQAAATYKKAADYARLLKDKFSQARSHIGRFDFRYVLTAIYGGIPSSRIQYYEYYLHRHSDKKEVAAIRYALAFQLAQKKQFKAALEQISWLETYSRNPQIIELKRYCLQQKQKTMLSLLAVYNDTIYGSDLRKLKALDENWDTYSEALSFFYPEREEELEEIKEYIGDRIKGLLLKNQSYAELFDLLTKDKDFYYDSSSLKLAAVTAFRLLVAGDYSQTQRIKKALASWLTAIYTNEVIFDSLEDTEWDDDYSFSVHNILGYSYEELYIPENINSRAPNEQNIDLGQVQQRLLKKLEDLINNQLPADLLAFYEKEKAALALACKLFKESDIVLASPYIMESAEGILLEISISQLNHFKQNTEDIDLILPYSQTVSEQYIPDLFKTFHLAQKTEKNLPLLFEQLKRQPQLALRQAKLQLKSLRALKREFPQHYQRLKVSCIQQLNEHLDHKTREPQHVQLLDFLRTTVFEQDQEIQQIQADYICNAAIAEYNAEKIQPTQSLNYMIEAYDLDSSSNRIQNNLATIVEIVARQHAFSADTSGWSTIKSLYKRVPYSYQLQLQKALKTAYNDCYEILENSDPILHYLIFSQLGHNEYSFSISHKLDSIGHTLNHGGQGMVRRLQEIKDYFS